MEQDTEVKLPHFIGVFENNKLVLRVSMCLTNIGIQLTHN